MALILDRVLLADRLQQSLAQGQRKRQGVAVVFLDLDGFKAVNDHHGHDAGDALLVEASRRMPAHALPEWMAGWQPCTSWRNAPCQGAVPPAPTFASPITMIENRDW